MLEHVGESFLHDPVHGELSGGVKCRAVDVYLQAHIEAGRADAVDQLAELVEGRLRCEFSCIVFA